LVATFPDIVVDDTFIEFAKNTGRAVGILMLSHSFKDISISGVGRHFWLSIIIEVAQGQFLQARRGQKSHVHRWNFDDACLSYLTDISTSGLGVILLF